MTPKPYKPPTQEEYEHWLARLLDRSTFVLTSSLLALFGIRDTIESITVPFESDATGPIGTAFHWFTHYALGPLMLILFLSHVILLRLQARRLKKQTSVA